MVTGPEPVGVAVTPRCPYHLAGPTTRPVWPSVSIMFPEGYHDKEKKLFVQGGKNAKACYATTVKDINY